MSTAKFKTKPLAEVRSLTHKVRVTPAEDLRIRREAAVRNLDVAEYYRRVAMSRPAKVDMEVQQVLAMADSTRAIRELHAAFVERGIEPPTEILLIPILAAAETMARMEAKSGRAAIGLLNLLSD